MQQKTFDILSVLLLLTGFNFKIYSHVTCIRKNIFKNNNIFAIEFFFILNIYKHNECFHFFIKNIVYVCSFKSFQKVILEICIKLH